MSTLQVLQMELSALVDKNPQLDDFDGGRIKCADPPDMKGKRPLHVINCKNISVLFSDKEKFFPLSQAKSTVSPKFCEKPEVVGKNSINIDKEIFIFSSHSPS